MDSFISFIIPALNEERNIVHAIDSISEAMGDNGFEIIVADNGSVDRTCELASEHGAKVVTDRSATIAGLRNLGVDHSRGAVLVFIDADVRLATDWHGKFVEAARHWPENRRVVTGSTCLVPDSASFIEKHWFHRLQNADTAYINSGHMITTRELFNAISGFDDQLKTAEDYDFCQRARALGGTVVKASDIRAFHHGYPTGIGAFIIREAWHGRDDVASWKKFLASKTALAAVFNSLLILSALAALLLYQHIPIAVVLLLASLTLTLLLTRIKFGKSRPIDTFKTALCFEFYLLGRTLSYIYKKNRPAARS